ncbi:hypothetical protein C0Q70_19800 [Pomacea canaliculata]|uniref:Uncharacterized protein n=1 Tax=Pomacea canaliculata TaxID=400727 RepID=A0A2T7NDR5_POMCA|nr:hypothetical protein C0Q70_19800 [Pomacea canaliculata]
MTRNERTARAKLRLSAFSDPEPRFGRQGSRCHLTPRELKVPRGLGSLWGLGGNPEELQGIDGPAAPVSISTTDSAPPSKVDKRQHT